MHTDRGGGGGGGTPLATFWGYACSAQSRRGSGQLVKLDEKHPRRPGDGRLTPVVNHDPDGGPGSHGASLRTSISVAPAKGKLGICP